MLKTSAITTKTYRELLKILKDNNIALVRDEKTLKSKVLDKLPLRTKILDKFFNKSLIESVSEMKGDDAWFYNIPTTKLKHIAISRDVKDPHAILATLSHELGHALNKDDFRLSSFKLKKSLKTELKASRKGLDIVKQLPDIDTQDIELIKKHLNNSYKTYLGSGYIKNVASNDSLQIFYKDKYDKLLRRRKRLSALKDKVISNIPDPNQRIPHLLDITSKELDTVTKIRDLHQKAYDLRLNMKHALGEIMRRNDDYNSVNINIDAYKTLKSLRRKYKVNMQRNDPVTQLLRNNPDLREV